MKTAGGALMRRTGQIEAKTGDYVDSFTSEADVLAASERLEEVVHKERSRRELVYCRVPGRRDKLGETWQVYLLP